MLLIVCILSIFLYSLMIDIGDKNDLFRTPSEASFELATVEIGTLKTLTPDGIRVQYHSHLGAGSNFSS